MSSSAETTTTAVELVIDPRERPVGSGTVRRLLPYRERRMVGPFVFTDLVGPETIDSGDRIDVDAHPHIGLATVTYLLAGRLVHRDSTGVVQAIDPGAVNWMTAGSGVTHTERSHPDDVAVPTDLLGVQTWVALPEENQEAEPRFENLAVADVPVEQRGGSRVRLAVGTGWGMESPITVSSPLVLASIDLVDRSPVPIDTGHREQAVLAVDGFLTIDGRPLDAGRLAVIRPGSTPQLGGVGRAIVLGGEPLGKRHIWWNFVHSDRDRIEQAKADWLAQRFPTVPDDHEPWVPLPGS